MATPNYLSRHSPLPPPRTTRSPHDSLHHHPPPPPPPLSSHSLHSHTPLSPLLATLGSASPEARGGEGGVVVTGNCLSFFSRSYSPSIAFFRARTWSPTLGEDHVLARRNTRCSENKGEGLAEESRRRDSENTRETERDSESKPYPRRGTRRV